LETALALFGIGDTIEIVTVKRGERVKFQMNWNDLKGTHGRNYKPKVIAREKCKNGKGTIITVSGLKRKSPFDVKAVALSLAKLFNLFDNTFRVYVTKGNVKVEVNSKLRYSGLDTQFEFTFPEYADEMKADYENKGKILGIIITTEKPLVPGLRGITLFANGRLVNAAEFFGRSESSHFYSYVTGWLDIDFVDDWEEDVISTNRQSLNWEVDRTRILREFLQKTLSEIQKDWRKKRKAKRRKEISKKIDIDVDEWYSKLPTDIQPKIERIVDSVEDSELSEDDQKEVVANMHYLIPEYPYYHWRHLHREIQAASEVEYKSEDYYRAFLEAAKRYINNVREKSGLDDFRNDQTMMAEVFGNNRLLLLVEKYRKRNGDEFSRDTVNNIQNGQHFLSNGVVAGGRNPLSHEEIAEVKESGLFTEKDCLDLLSILSHLFRRLDDAELKNS